MRTALLLIAATAALAVPPTARAGHLFCDRCGCHQNCRKVCKLVCEKKKETTTEYTSECEDFCIPGPSHKCGVRYEHDECGGHPDRKIIWQPTCAKVHTRKKLVKKEITKEVPDYKWVVEEYCCICGMLVKMERGDGKSGKDAADGKSDGGDSGGDKPGGDKPGGDKSNGDKPGSQGGKKRTGQVLPTETGPLVLLPSIREYRMPSFERWRDNAPSSGDDYTGSQASSDARSAGAPAAEKSAKSEPKKTASDARDGRSPPPRRLFRALFVR